MLALSIVAPNGRHIASGRKTLEIRSWRPPRWPLRDLLIVENRIVLTGEDQRDPDGVAVALVDVDDVHAWQPSEREAACWSDWQPGLWAWQVSRVRPIRGIFQASAQRKLYDVQPDAALLECLASLRE